MKQRILIVDDEKNIRRTLSIVLEGAGYAVRQAGSGEECLSLLEESPSDMVLLDVGLPGRDGIATLKEIRARCPDTAIVMISGQATVATAVEATRLGAFDFLEKPLAKERVLIAVRNALKATTLGEEVNRYKRSEALRYVMIGESAAVRQLRHQIEKVGPTGATVLIVGESGSGKELVARGLHEASPRAGRPFIKLNCAAIPEELIETELFGCLRGAYTGADRSRDGKFLLADGGSLFLDEVGDMSLRVQAKVLRALQEGEIERVGDSKVHRVDVRVVAATNKDLLAEVAAGRFREDLYFRLNVIPIQVPPLRERREDIGALADHFLKLYAAENDLPVKDLSAGARALLCRMEWRGNVREVRNVIERLAILTDGSRIEEGDVRVCAGGVDAVAAPRGMRSAAGSGGMGGGGGTAPGGLVSAGGGVPAAPEYLPAGFDAIRLAGGLLRARREFERRCIELALDQSSGNVSEAARLLGIERSNLHKKMQAYRLEARPPRPGGRAEEKGVGE